MSKVRGLGFQSWFEIVIVEGRKDSNRDLLELLVDVVDYDFRVLYIYLVLFQILVVLRIDIKMTYGGEVIQSQYFVSQVLQKEIKGKKVQYISLYFMYLLD